MSSSRPPGRISVAGRLKAAASLAINAAVRSSDCICVVELGYHTAAASHAAAIDVLGQVPDAESLTDALSGATEPADSRG